VFYRPQVEVTATGVHQHIFPTVACHQKELANHHIFKCAIGSIYWICKFITTTPSSTLIVAAHQPLLSKTNLHSRSVSNSIYSISNLLEIYQKAFHSSNSSSTISQDATIFDFIVAHSSSPSGELRGGSCDHVKSSSDYFV
jgi:hypothetical protein